MPRAIVSVRSRRDVPAVVVVVVVVMVVVTRLSRAPFPNVKVHREARRDRRVVPSRWRGILVEPAPLGEDVAAGK